MIPNLGDLNTSNLGFYVSRKAREHYQLDQTFFLPNGTVSLTNAHAARVFAQAINQHRDLVNQPERAVNASQLNAVALISEITHYVFRVFCQRYFPNVLAEALSWLESRIEPVAVNATLQRFVSEFPPLAVYNGQVSAEQYLQQDTDGVSNRQTALENMLMLWIANRNPAFGPFQELFDDQVLAHDTAYASLIHELYQFFDGRPISSIGGEDLGIALGVQSNQATPENLIDLLRLPARLAPHSLEAQLRLLTERWGTLIEVFTFRLYSSLDMIKEEEKPSFFGPGPVEVPTYDASVVEFEPERFTPDSHWMPELVMIAKNAYVWLDQLSKAYGYTINTLDQIPDEELDRLARAGISGLWLIGLWERSKASQRIKQIMGNPDAVASAYSLYDYQIAAKLGGEAACNNLRHRAWQRGIRLASDMVPNHVGIDGRWVIEHPDWFVSLDYSPFPSYTFNGENLSTDPRVGIYLEDHYFDRTDASVVFKRVDNWSGETRYVYHGNDGTTFPWNDTAQLNYLNPEVREAVIQTILHVARQFPIIRFDAAMTLAKRHFHRLWYPEPGSGGDIPSRSQFGLTKAQFDAAMPEEFWREVVDRCAVEAPDTLLLAEAFWMMESYFVRSLGMHRVYNSAFMVLLRDEDNAKYRYLMKNTLEFDPEILKRYVNFVNNPDERTAVDQFGKGDKYFGVAVMMSTMPGLPMFGHGQLEGFTERYGMEYQRAYWDEQVDQDLMDRHEREIFPLLHRRYLFAEVENFLLFDFYTDGGVNENVFAYSNRVGEERALVVYNNQFSDTRGWIRVSAAFSQRTGNGDERVQVQRTLGEGLQLHNDANYYTILRDHISGLEYIRNSKDLCEQGLFVELGAYNYRVFIDIYEVQETPGGHYGRIATKLGGAGTQSIEHTFKELLLEPLHRPFRAVVNGENLRKLEQARLLDTEQPLDVALLDELELKLRDFFTQAKLISGSNGDPIYVAHDVRLHLESVLRIPIFESRKIALKAKLRPAKPKEENGLKPKRTLSKAVAYNLAVHALNSHLEENPTLWPQLFIWAVVQGLGKLDSAVDHADISRSRIDEWLLHRQIRDAFAELGHDFQASERATTIIKRLVTQANWYKLNPDSLVVLIEDWLQTDYEFQSLLGVNEYEEELWFNQESFEQILLWFLALAAVTLDADPSNRATEATVTYAQSHATIKRIQAALKESGYKVNELLSLLA